MISQAAQRIMEGAVAGATMAEQQEQAEMAEVELARVRRAEPPEPQTRAVAGVVRDTTSQIAAGSEGPVLLEL